MEEQEAQELMRTHRVERDIFDTSSCAQIVDRLGLVPRPVLKPTPQDVQNQIQAENMVAHVGPEPSPYFFS